MTLQTSKEARYMPCYHRSYLLLFQGIWSAYFKKVLFKSTAQCMPWWLWFGKFQILINYLHVKKVVLDINCCWNDSFLFREIRKIRWSLSFQMLASSAYITWCKLSETKKVYFSWKYFLHQPCGKVLRGILKLLCSSQFTTINAWFVIF